MKKIFIIFLSSLFSTIALGQTFQNGNLTLNGSISGHGLLSSPLSTPAISSVVNGGASGSTNWCYKITGLNTVGETVGSTAVCNGSGPATLTSPNSEIITWTAINGATGYNVYRTTAGGTPNTIGKMTGSSNVQGLTFTDTGTAGDTTTPPSSDSSGNYQLTSGNKLCFDAATCINSVDYNTSNAGYLTLKSNNSGIILSSPTFTPNTFGFNGAAASSFDFIRSNAGSGSFAYRLFNDNSTTAIFTLSPTGVLITTDGTPGHQLQLIPGVNPALQFGSSSSLQIQSSVGGSALTFPSEAIFSGPGGTAVAAAGITINNAQPLATNGIIEWNGTASGSLIFQESSTAFTGSLAFEWFKDAGITEAMGLTPSGNLQTLAGFSLTTDTTHLAPISIGTTTQEAEEHGAGVTCSTTGTAVGFTTFFKASTTPVVMVTVVSTSASTAFSTSISSVSNTGFTVTVGSTTNCGSIMWSAHGDK